MKLTPLVDVVLLDGRTVSQSCLPWLRIEAPARQWAGRWVRLVFEASLLDPLTRPVLRIIRPGGDEDVILPAPSFGRGSWIGFLPSDATELHLSPADWIGPFGFRVVSLGRVGPLRRLGRGARRHPKAVMSALWAGMRGDRQVKQARLKRALGATPLAMYEAWRLERSRTIEWTGLDMPSQAAADTGFHLVIIGDPSKHAAAWHGFLASQPLKRITLSWASPRTPLAPLLDAGRDDDLVIGLRVDDRLNDFALAAVAQRSIEDPAALYYGDEECNGSPRFKPDWSPVLARHAALVGQAWFARNDWLRQVMPSSATVEDLVSRPPIDALVRAVHIRRILLATSHASPAIPLTPLSPAVMTASGRPPMSTVIIPTRDRVDLLSACVGSLLERSPQDHFEVVIIDNGSKEPSTLAYLDTVTRDSRFSVLRSPGSFNFAAICNEAAGRARGDTLVFLNNDTEILSDGWLSRLTGWARQPDIGAVGAKLLYKDDTLQHGGVVLGMGGRAAHFERRLPRSDTGFFGRLSTPHELSAVTAACLAVSSEKFRRIGGFDQHNLPIDLNDIDLCLRLNECGWRTLLDPCVVLHHHESASRSSKAPSEVLYGKEIGYFRSKWLHLLRNDPYFHPALSLEWYRAALG
ncbi:glycosyltransferase family 2 protein [Labrys sp. LIt4]|uniref:Glycosyl transferase family 2 n=1 Tax=Labrys okinawensis TaxID=346911 RepID=A0A2S9Q3I9_9HYPH|nr:MULTISPECIES: glycosyltransferase [Labrys]MBP0581364.1 glycosyltransferase family 2 protein [Labrys sp. LIt4]PRH83922.1 glycosyl transferase family 2 [Labrys okinawensis]